MSNKLTADIVVVGAGFAGLSAALEARFHGASVILLCDRGPMANNSAISGGVFAFAGSPGQVKMGIKDSPELLSKDIMKASNSKADVEMVETAASASGALYDWLTGFGANFHWIKPISGHSVVRVHEEIGEKDTRFGRGSRLVKLMQAAAKANGVDVRMRTPAIGLTIDKQGRVVGVKARNGPDGEVGIEARRGVILAAGGFSKNQEMVKKYASGLVGVLSASAGGCTGDGIRMGMEAGAALANMDAAVMSYTIYAKGNKSRNMERALRPAMPESILVNKEGQRFMDETLVSYRVACELMRQRDRVVFMIFDAETATKAGLTGKEKLMSAANPEELAINLKFEVLALSKTITDYNKTVPKIDAYGKPVQRRPLSGRLFAFPITARILMTYGGLKINKQTQVISSAGKIIPGLFAAGDNAFGLCGPSDGYNAVPGYLTGCGNMAALVFGRIAGRNAAKG